MRFLFRIIFWLGVVIVLIPRGGGATKSDVLVSAGEAISAAKATVSDARGFCERQPEACAVGSQAAVAIGQRAQVGAKMLYNYFNERVSGGESPDGTHGTSRRPIMPGVMRSTGDTLVPADLAVPWRGPRPRKEPASERPQ
jgi:hypothetical protein